MYGLVAGLSCGLLMFLMTPLLPEIANKNTEYNSYFIEADVEQDCELIGKSVEENHLRNLPELFLIEIARGGKLITPVTPDEVIQSGDKLIFSGNIQHVGNLSHIKGLKLFAESNGCCEKTSPK